MLCRPLIKVIGKTKDMINKAIAEYFSIEKNYKAMYAAQENYEAVKEKYLRGIL